MSRARAVVVCVFLFSVGFARVSPVRAQVSCGDVITDKRVMTANLNNCISTAVTIGSGGSLDMAGYEITFPGATGVLMNGDGGTLKNGSIQLCGQSGVVISGDGNKVENVSVRTCVNGFEISGAKAKLERAVAIQNTNHGFLILVGGVKTFIRQSYAFNNAGDGFQVDGEGSKLAGVVADRNQQRGVDVSAAKVKLSEILAFENDDGIVTTGVGTKLQRVFSVRNDFRDIGLDGASAKVKQATTISAGTFASIWITGTGNSLDKSTGGLGFNNLFVSGDGNKVQRMLSVGSSDAGIDLGATADANSVKRSFSAFGSSGIRVSGGSTNNQLSDNASSDNFGPFDLIDGNPSCGTNTWKNNSGVAIDPCID